MRLPLLVFGLVAVSWSAATLPGFWLAVSAREVVARILTDQSFRPAPLSHELQFVQAGLERLTGRSDLVRAEALMRLWLAGDAGFRKSSDEADSEAAFASEKLKLSLSRNPADSFMWLQLYSAENARHGFSAGRIDLLAQSYATGPLEGWIALRRNAVGLSIFEFADEYLQDKIVLEFQEIVDGPFISEAVTSLTGMGWPYRERLLVSLERADITSREDLAKRLYRGGFNVSVPGVILDERFMRQ